MRELANIFTVVCAVLTLLSCNKISESCGTISFGLTSSEAIKTEVKSISNDELQAFSITVPNSVISGTYGDIKGLTYTLSPGNYTAYAQNCTAEEAENHDNGLGRIRYYGEKSFKTMPANQTISIHCIVINSRLSLYLDQSFSDFFDLSSTTVTVAGDNSFANRAIDMITPDSAIDAIYFNDGNPVYIRVNTKRRGGSEQLTYNLKPFAASAGCWKKITIRVNPNTSTGGITFHIEDTDITTGNSIGIEDLIPSTITED